MEEENEETKNQHAMTVQHRSLELLMPREKRQMSDERKQLHNVIAGLSSKKNSASD